MAKTEKQKLKLYLLIELFKRKSDAEHPISIAYILEYFQALGISAERKSIYRDIQAMEELGFEVIKTHDKKFGYFLINDGFETAELRLLADAVQSSRFITKNKSSELIKKLESLTTEYDAKKLESRVFVTNRIKTSNESIYYSVDAIDTAIADDCMISFKYFDWTVDKRRLYRKNGSEYIVSPWALVWDNENYYLIAYDGDEGIIKHYRVDRMNSINVVDAPRDGQNSFKEVDVAEYSKKFFGMYNGEIERVTLNCANELVNSVIDRFGTDAVFEPQSNNATFNVTVDVAVTPVFLSWVFMFGGKIKIKTPGSANKKLREMAESILNL